MADIHCANPACQEPWDSYGITVFVGEGDLSREEAARFRRGEGCPSCNWGTDPAFPTGEADEEEKELDALDTFLSDLAEASDEDPILLLNEVLTTRWKGRAA